jgi:hypothetical protein
MPRSARKAAKKASSKLENVQVLSDESASSFEAASQASAEIESDVQSDAQSEGFSQDNDNINIAVEVTSRKEPQVKSKQKKFKMVFIQDKAAEELKINQVIPEVEAPTPVQKFSFHNPKYTPILQLEDKDFEKYKNAILAQIPSIKSVDEMVDLKFINGRIPCPLKKCDKTFLNYMGIKYHFTNFIHLYEALGLPASECQLPRDYYPIAIPWLMTCKPRKKPSDFGFLIGLPAEENGIDSKSAGAGKMSLIRNQNVSVDKFHPSNLSKHNLPSLLTQPTLSKSTVFYKPVVNDEKVYGYFDYIGGGYTEPSNPVDSQLNERLTDIPDLYIKVKGEQFKIKRFQSLQFTKPRSHSIVNCGVFVKCIEWINKYVVVGGETDDTIDGLLQVYEILDSSVELKTLIRHTYGTVIACKWCRDSYLPSKRLGFLIAAFGDGGVRVLDVPHPSDRDVMHLEVRKPVFEFVPKDYAIISFAWDNKKNFVACGTDHGKQYLMQVT